MSLGQKLLELRKKKNLSQEEVAEKLEVSRQTISKWETDQSTPDFDKIIPLCELYAISTEELLRGKKEVKKEMPIIDSTNQIINKKKRALGISSGILLYFIAIAWVTITIPVFKMNPIIASSIFLVICGLATFFIIYTTSVYKVKEVKNKIPHKLRHQINLILAILFTIIYLIISFSTFAWYITWILWIVYGLVCEIVKLVFMLKGLE